MKNFVISVIVIFCSGIIISGCLQVEKMSVSYDIKQNLTGNVKLEFTNINSSETIEADKKKEMADFYEGYIEDGKEFASSWCLKEVKVELNDKTDLKCDALVTGAFNNIIGTLHPIIDDSNFEIRQKNNTFAVKIDSCTLSTKELPAEVSIRYKGKILSHNAHLFDKKQNRMVWSGEKMKNTGIRFALEIDKSNKTQGE